MQFVKLVPGLLVGGIIFFEFSSAVFAEQNGINDSQRVDVLNEYVDDSGITTGSIIRDSEMLSYCINISDIAGLRPWASYPVHSISKAGVEMLTQVAAVAFAPDIRVNGVAPGPVMKPEFLDDDRWNEIGAALPLLRTGNAGDVSRAVIFLCENDYITGETLAVDGGNKLL